MIYRKMNIEKKMALFFGELVDKIREGWTTVIKDDCENKHVYVDVTIGYNTSDVARVEHKIELWMEKEELEEHVHLHLQKKVTMLHLHIFPVKKKPLLWRKR